MVSVFIGVFEFYVQPQVFMPQKNHFLDFHCQEFVLYPRLLRHFLLWIKCSGVYEWRQIECFVTFCYKHDFCFQYCTTWCLACTVDEQNCSWKICKMKFREVRSSETIYPCQAISCRPDMRFSSVGIVETTSNISF